MDRPDTELKKIVDYLATNSYEFEGTTSEVIINRSRYPDDAIAYFKKNIDYTDPDGNRFNDSEINVSIQFKKRADYKNFTHYGIDVDEREGDDEYIGDPDDFIRGLMGEEIQGSTARGTRRKNRKTRRNKRKSSNRHRK